jgi:hypothetical protein
LQKLLRFEHEGQPATGVLEVESAGDGVPLTPKEYERYVVLAGEPAKTFLDKFIQTDQYKNGTDGPDGRKALMIQKLVQNHRDAALGKLIQEFPELREKMVERRRVRAKALTVGME